jgi:hypothetical protein
MTQAPLTIRRWKRIEYDRLVDLGMFEGEPLELIGGQLIVGERRRIRAEGRSALGMDREDAAARVT